MRHSLLTIAAAATLLGGIACHDTTAPVASPPHATSPTRTVVTAGPVVVTPTAMGGWSFEEEGPRGGCADLTRCHLVDGPGAPPLGTGSAALTPTHHSSAILVLRGHAGVRLYQMDELRFATFLEHDSKRGDAEVTLQLSVDY